MRRIGIGVRADATTRRLARWATGALTTFTASAHFTGHATSAAVIAISLYVNALSAAGCKNGAHGCSDGRRHTTIDNAAIERRATAI